MKFICEDCKAKYQIADEKVQAFLAGGAPKKREFQGTTVYEFDVPEMPNQNGQPNPIKGPICVAIAKNSAFVSTEPSLLEHELLWLKRHSRRLLWLNPLLRFEGYAPLARGAGVLHRQADAMLAVHNLSALEQLAASLAALMRSGR